MRSGGIGFIQVEGPYRSGFLELGRKGFRGGNSEKEFNQVQEVKVVENMEDAIRANQSRQC